MNKNSIKTQIVVQLLLVVILYMHVCSALCATTSHSCCRKEGNDNCKNESCEDDNDADHKDSGCQNRHFAFFNTTGQFVQAKADISFKLTQSLVVIVAPLFIFEPTATSKIKFAYNGFHPPPPKADIRIFISSFQIWFIDLFFSNGRIFFVRAGLISVCSVKSILV